ncbi:unnamed protein product [Psylliodes chrysocephalus]|uniref:Uncharacterized protein n=1 Tax=Psylliodes chrysocephalus TaxID=3402493 RepID=A0A9P0CYM5_9CUCU|nr:unnamed protein product [Psylliodes chrysocephala]
MLTYNIFNLTNYTIKRNCCTKNRPDKVKKLKHLQDRFQCDDGLPVWLKTPRDRLLFKITALGCAFGVTWGFPIPTPTKHPAIVALYRSLSVGVFSQTGCPSAHWYCFCSFFIFAIFSRLVTSVTFLLNTMFVNFKRSATNILIFFDFYVKLDNKKYRNI